MHLCSAAANAADGTRRNTSPSTNASSFRDPTSIIPGLEHASLSVDPRWEPGAGNPHAGFCPGGGSKGPSLPERDLGFEVFRSSGLPVKAPNFPTSCESVSYLGNCDFTGSVEGGIRAAMPFLGSF